MHKKALIVVDYQYDFADPNGSLYVDGGEKLKEPIKKRIDEYKNNNWIVIFSCDFHPEDHISFEKWGPHCVQNSIGASFYIEHNDVDLIIKKGIDADGDSYSAFYTKENLKSSLDAYLKINNVDELEICGLALDVCVKATFDDAIKFGYKSFINEKLSKPLDKTFKLTSNI